MQYFTHVMVAHKNGPASKYRRITTECTIINATYISMLALAGANYTHIQFSGLTQYNLYCVKMNILSLRLLSWEGIAIYQAVYA